MSNSSTPVPNQPVVRDLLKASIRQISKYNGHSEELLDQIANALAGHVEQSLPTVSAEPAWFKTVVDAIVAMPFKQVVLEGLKRFAEESYARIIYYSYVLTVKNKFRPEIDPQYVVPNFIGGAGSGKSGTYHATARAMSRFLSDLAGVPVKFRFKKLSLNGRNDFGDAIGVTTVDWRQTPPRTVLAVSAGVPVEADYTAGCMVLDEFNRAFKHVKSAGMELVDEGHYGGYDVPTLWMMGAACNYSGGSFQVEYTDDAHWTRFINIPFNPDAESFLRQVDRMKLNGRYTSFLYKNKHSLPKTFDPTTQKLCEREIDNFRVRTFYGIWFDIIDQRNEKGELLDPSVHLIITKALLGTKLAGDITAYLDGDTPVAAEDLMWSDVGFQTGMITVKQYIKSRKSDLVQSTMNRMIDYLNNPEFIPDQEDIQKVARFIDALPEDLGFVMMQRLAYAHAPRRGLYEGPLSNWGAKGSHGGKLIEKFASKLK